MKTISGIAVVACEAIGTAIAANGSNIEPNPTGFPSLCRRRTVPQRLGHGAFSVKVTKTLDSSKTEAGRRG